ncbi:MAG: TIGR01777 family oxidoreductase [Candidatus Thermoplasmatota archaeon]
MRILVTGASGLLGRRLLPALLAAGHSVVALSRTPLATAWPPGVTALTWTGALPEVGAVDGVVNLAGEPIIGRRWNEEQKRRLIASRVDGTRALVAGLGPQASPPILVNASAVGHYGILTTAPCPEETPAANDFLAQLCASWEAAARAYTGRSVQLRFGHLLDASGGYLGKLLPILRAGVGGPIGNGRQPMPWVHIDDAVGAILWALTTSTASGPYNVVAPERVNQGQFTRALGRHLHRPTFLPVPAFALRLRFGEVAPVLAGGQDAPPYRLLGEGYRFRHPELVAALPTLL